MRALTAAQEAILNTGSFSVGVRVSVKDSGGTWRDLTTYADVDLLESVSINRGVDQPVKTADITLKREAYALTLAPLMTASPLNRNFDPATAYAPLIDKWRDVKVETALGFAGTAPSSGWLQVFIGRIDDVDTASGPNVKLSCRDQGGLLQDVQIEEERVYAFDVAGTAIKGLRIWRPSTAYALGDLVIPSGKLNDTYYEVTVAGTSGATEPVWPLAGSVAAGATFTVEGNTSSAGKPVELVMQSILNDWLGAGAPTLYVPVSPAWSIKEFQQDRGSVYDALHALAQQIGWDVRYLWRESTSQEELTLWCPDRTKTVADRTITSSQYLEVEQLHESISSMRTVVRVYFNDSTDRWPDGNAKRKFVTAENATAIAALGGAENGGRRFCEFAEEKTSNIDTPAEAQRMADAAVSDMSEPGAELGITDFYLPVAELADLYEFSPNGIYWDTAQKKAVVGIRDELSAKSCRTSLTLRGKPSTGKDAWERIEARYAHPKHAYQIFSGKPASISAQSIIGGARLHGAPPSGKWKHSKAEGYELHVSSTDGFTPDSSSFVGRGQLEDISISHLTPGQTYYARKIPYGFNDHRLVRGEPGEQEEFVAGYVQPRHLHPSLELGFGGMPHNGSFEIPGTADTIPEGWEADPVYLAGSSFEDDWNVDVGDAYDGKVSVEFLASANGQTGLQRTEMRPCKPSTGYTMEIAIKPQASFPGARHVAYGVRWYTSAGTVISSSTPTLDLDTLTEDVWQLETITFTSPSSAAFMREVVFEESGDADFAWKFDAVRVYETPAASGGGLDGTPHMRAYLSADQTINEVAVTTVLYDTVDWDTDGIYDDTTGLVTIPEDGYYRIKQSAIWQAASSVLYALEILVRFTGPVYRVPIREGLEADDVTHTSYKAAANDDTLFLTAGTTFDVVCYHDNSSSSTLTLKPLHQGTFLEVQRVR